MPSLVLSDVVSQSHRSSGGCSEECLVATTVFAKGKVVLEVLVHFHPYACMQRVSVTGKGGVRPPSPALARASFVRLCLLGGAPLTAFSLF